MKTPHPDILFFSPVLVNIYKKKKSSPEEIQPQSHQETRDKAKPTEPVPLAGALSSEPPTSSKPTVLSHVQKPKVSPSLLNPTHQDILS